MKQPIRFFSIGLLSSAIIMLGFYFFDDSSTETIENIPVDELITKVEEDGYRVITEDEFISYSLYTEQEKKEQTSEKVDQKQEGKDKKDKEKDKKEQAAKDKKDEKDKDDKKDTNKDKKDESADDKDKVIKAKFTTKSGVVSQDIADILVEKKIIEDRQKFVDYLEDNDYSPYIQLGTFEVNSDMTFKELAETVTTYPGD